MDILIRTNARKVEADLRRVSEGIRFITLTNAGKELRDEVQKNFERTWATWEHKPQLNLKVEKRGVGLRILAKVRDDIWHWLDSGTRARLIVPRQARALRFREGFFAKTERDNLFSRAGGPFGNWVYRRWVRHPGIEPRRFTREIFKEVARAAPVIIRKHLNRVLRSR